MPVLPFTFTPGPIPAERAAAPSLDEEAIRAHVELLHRQAAGLDGKLVLFGAGENPITGRKEGPRVEHFLISDVENMVDAILSFGNIPHLNSYLPWTVFRRSLGRGEKGSEADVIACLALVPDLDSDSGRGGMLPFDASYVVETSSGNFQAFYILDRPVSPKEAKPIAEALVNAVGCDYGTKDLSHVWRIPGTLNWPNKKKLQRGRSPMPQLVKVAEPWVGELISPEKLWDAVKDSAKHKAAQQPSNGVAKPIDDLMRRCGAVLRHTVQSPSIENEDRSETAFGVIVSLVRKGFPDVDIHTIVDSHPNGIGARYAEGKDLDADIRRAREKQPANAIGSPPAPAKPLPLMLASAFAETPVPPRHWHCEGLIPGRTVTLLGGDGGTGKSLLSLQLSVATATGSSWIGKRVEKGRVLHLTAEDDVDEMHRRLADISAATAIGIEAMQDLKIVALAGEDAVLASLSGKTGIIAPTEIWRQLESETEEWRPALIVLDTLADLFAGDENSRTQARQFIGILRGLAIRNTLTIVVLSHPSLTGMSSGTGASGSTGWSNSVRSRLYLERMIAEDKTEADPDLRVLTAKKANYSRTGDQIRLKWTAGIFRSEDENPNMKVAREVSANVADRTFINLLRKYEMEGRIVGANPSASFAPTIMSKDQRAHGITKQAFRYSMDRLFEAKRIRLETCGRPSDNRKRIAIVNPEEEDIQL